MNRVEARTLRFEKRRKLGEITKRKVQEGCLPRIYPLPLLSLSASCFCPDETALTVNALLPEPQNLNQGHTRT